MSSAEKVRKLLAPRADNCAEFSPATCVGVSASACPAVSALTCATVRPLIALASMAATCDVDNQATLSVPSVASWMAFIEPICADVSAPT